MLTPPKTTNDEGEERRVGFEIEYIGIDLAETAALIQEFCGEADDESRVSYRHKNSCKVETEAFGTFAVEVDVVLLQKLAESSRQNMESREHDLEGAVEELISPLITSFAPNEIVTPPIPVTRLGELEPLIDLLRDRGANGTDVSISYAFGLHINPEAPSLRAESLLAHLQAFLLLYDWLEDEMRMNLTRKVTSFAGGFSSKYAKLVLSPDYKPDLTRLIDDYLTHNPSRNRALDMLPLFAHLDRERVDAGTKGNTLVKPRPTYHLRMPNCKVDDPSWQLTVEWNRWVMVEKLAANDEIRTKMIEHRRQTQERLLDNLSETWLLASRNYVEQLR